MSWKNRGLSYVAHLVVLLFVALFFSTAAWAQNLEVNVETSKGRALSGLNVYAFIESGSYTGINATTDGNGTAIFDLDDFEAGTYKFRVDYLSYQFWSQVVSLPETSTVDVVIEEETAEVTVTTGAGPARGVRVYLFSGSGSYLGLYESTDTNGKVSFELPVGRDFKFRADILGNQYWSAVTTVSGGGVNNVSVDAGGGLLQVTVEKGPGIPMEGIATYLFNTSGAYLGLSQVTTASGLAEFSVPEGEYKVRADYLGSQFWSQEVLVTEDTSISLDIPHQDVVITVQGMYQGTPEPNTPSGSYLNQSRVTDAGGHVTFSLPEQAYKVRADYMTQQYWSEIFNCNNETITINEGIAEVTVTSMGQPLEGVNVYVFNSSGSYLGLYDVTDDEGKVSFRITISGEIIWATSTGAACPRSSPMWKTL